MYHIYDKYDDLVAEIGYFNHRVCTPAWIIEESILTCVDVTYILRGKAEYTIDSTKYILSAGDLACIPKGALRSAVSCPDDLMECYCVNGKVHNFSGEDTTMPLPLISHIGIQSDIIALYRDLNAAWLLRDPGYGMRVRAIYLMILQRYFQLTLYKNVSSTMDTRIRKVLRYLIDRYNEPITVQDMADMTGLSAMYFGNFFKRETGVSFRQYLMSIRLNHAEDMLQCGEYNVNEVAEACGFSDIFYFSKVFKESRGVSPSKVIRSRAYTDGADGLLGEQVTGNF